MNQEEKKEIQAELKKIKDAMSVIDFAYSKINKIISEPLAIQQIGRLKREVDKRALPEIFGKYPENKYPENRSSISNSIRD